MKRICFWTILFAVVALQPALAQQRTLSVCDYEPPESMISDLGLQGTFNWYDGPYLDDRNSSVSATLIADYNGFYSSADFGRQLTGRSEVRGGSSG